MIKFGFLRPSSSTDARELALNCVDHTKNIKYATERKFTVCAKHYHQSREKCDKDIAKLKRCSFLPHWCSLNDILIARQKTPRKC